MHAISVGCLVVAILAAPASASAMQGDLDPSFGNGGTVIHPLGALSFDEADAVATQPDGKLVVGGLANRQRAVFRLTSSGDLDRTFGGGDGIAPTPGEAPAKDVALAPDGSIVTGGRSGGNFYLARLTPDGSPDPSFGNGGVVVPALGVAEPQAIAVQANGRIVVAGTKQGNFFLARFRPTGSLDPAFGAGGIVTTDFFAYDDAAEDVIVQPDGEIVAAGTSAGDFVLARYDHEGTLDPGFGSGGRVVTNFGAWEACHRVALGPGGTIVAAGVSNGDFAVARYLPSGLPDPAFSDDGMAIGPSGGALGLAIQADGGAVVAGSRNGDFALARFTSAGDVDGGFGGGLVSVDFGAADAVRDLTVAGGDIVAVGKSTIGPYYNPTDEDVAIAAIQPNGDPDPAYGEDGKVTTPLTAGSAVDDIAATAAAPGDKLVVAGTTSIERIEGTEFAVARFTADGQLDPTFGGDGVVRTHFAPGSLDSAQDVAVEPNGDIVVAGSFAVARYLPDGHLDSSFGGDGVVTTPYDPTHYGSMEARAVVVQSDGSIVIGGSSAAGGTFLLARYQPNGDLDPTFGTGGVVTGPLSGYDAKVDSLALQPDGAIVAGGEYAEDYEYGRQSLVVARYLPDGTLDPSFHRFGYLVEFGLKPHCYAASAVAVAPAGKIVVGGRCRDWGVYRYLPDGTRDPSFDGDGVAVVRGLGYFTPLSDVAVRSDDTVLLGGGSNDFEVARLEGDGSLDLRFGQDGIVTTDLGGKDGSTAAALWSTNRLALAGNSDGSLAQRATSSTRRGRVFARSTPPPARTPGR
jgi:uncharacterized delta-60 repeat protein